jgi:GNAT superfamily N-acetyltransferase
MGSSMGPDSSMTEYCLRREWRQVRYKVKKLQGYSCDATRCGIGARVFARVWWRLGNYESNGKLRPALPDIDLKGAAKWPERLNFMKIRKGILKDADIIAGFNVKLARESEDLELDLNTVTQGVTALLNDPAKGVYFVVEEDSQIIGQLLITYEWSDWRNGNFWWIQSVFVKEECRGRGVFASLFEHVRGLAREEGDVCGLRLYMEQENERARRAYKKLGFEQTHYQVFECSIGDVRSQGERGRKTSVR